MGPMSRTEGERGRVRLTPRDAVMAQLRAMKKAFGGTLSGLAAECLEAGLPLVTAKKLAAAKELSRTTGGRKA